MKNLAKLKEVTICGYKSISADKPIHLKFQDVTIMLGANGSGKSNIVTFFRMLGYVMSGSLQRYVAEYGTNVGLLHYGPKNTPCIDAEIVFNDAKCTDTYKLELSRAEPGRLIITKEELLWTKYGEKVPYNSHIESNYQESGLVQSNDKTARTVRSMLSNCKAYQFHDSSQNGLLRQSSLVNGARYLQSEGNNLASFIYMLRAESPDSYSRIVSYVQMIMPQFRDFYLEPINGYVQLNWKDNSLNDYVFTPNLFSDGTIRFIALAALLLQPSERMPSVIFIDEPELGLHPYAIDCLTEMIKDASLHSQVVLSTQSPQLIDGFSADQITVLEYDDDANSTVAHQLNKEDLADWLSRYQLSELWNKNILGGRPL